MSGYLTLSIQVTQGVAILSLRLTEIFEKELYLWLLHCGSTQEEGRSLAR